MTKLLLLNGPPGSGKDFIGNLIHRMDPTFTHVDKFARELKEMAHRAHGFPTALHNAFEDGKDVPQSYLGGRTWRMAYIAMSEQYAKPLFGQDYWGVCLARDLNWHMKSPIRRNGAPTLIVITDSGFEPEATRLLAECHGMFDQVRLVRLSAPGKTFAGDSRRYITLPGVEMAEVWNPLTPEVWGNLRQGLSGFLGLPLTPPAP